MRTMIDQIKKDKRYYRRIFGVGFPLLFGSITRYIYQITDSAMLGHHGNSSKELAAIGIASLFSWILMNFLWPMGNGVQAITSRRYGMERSGLSDPAATGSVLDNGLVTIIFAFVLSLAVSFSAAPILGLLVKDAEVLSLALQYIGIIRFGLLPVGIMIMVSGFLSAVNKTSYVMVVNILSHFLNIGFNFLLIYGNFGFPEMGIRGAAIGTVLSEVVAVIALLAMVFAGKYAGRYGLFRFKGLKKTLQLDIVAAALPTAIQNIVAFAIFLFYQTIIEDYSSVFLAATHSVFAYSRLNKTIIGGIARGAGILVGNSLGVKDKASAWIYVKSAFVISFAVAVCVAAFSFFGRGFVARIFSDDAATIAAIEGAMVFFVLFFFAEALGYCFEMIFVSNGYGKYVLASEFSTNIIFLLGTTVLARYLAPDNIVWAWLSFGVYQISHAGILVIGFLRKKWLDTEVEKEPK